jgi:solute carrier family 25 citrate transporter 1
VIKSSFKDPETGTLSPLRNLLAGMTSGVVASATAVTPTERVKTALIDDARTDRRFRSAPHCIRCIVAEHGVLGLYRGFAGTTLKQAGATAFRLGTYNILKDYQTRREIPQSTLMNFANGSVAGIVTTYTTQPFDMIKTRCQSSAGASTVEAFKTIMKDYGVRGFWRGTTMRLGRTVFSGGILFTSYEWAAALLMPVFVAK